jgi:beta-phosphoglucomutase-like phosphatase (HAD superfamily)
MWAKQHRTARERKGLMRSKRQTTRAKLARERLVQERRALKREKKRAAATARDEAAAVPDAQAVDGTVSVETDE